MKSIIEIFVEEIKVKFLSELYANFRNVFCFEYYFQGLFAYDFSFDE